MKRSRLFEQLYGDMIVNFETSSRQEDYQHPAILYICGENACDNSYVQQLFDWRHQQGYIVYTATESEVGGNNASTSEIKNSRCKSSLEKKRICQSVANHSLDQNLMKKKLAV